MQVGARQWETTPNDVINVLPSYLKGNEGLRKILLIKNGFILKQHIYIFVPEPEQNVREFWQKLHETGLIFFHKNTNRVNRNPYLTKNKQLEVENVHDKQNQNFITLRPDGSLELFSSDRKIILSLRTTLNPSPSGIPSRYVDKHRTRLHHIPLSSWCKNGDEASSPQKSAQWCLQTQSLPLLFYVETYTGGD